MFLDIKIIICGSAACQHDIMLWSYHHMQQQFRDSCWNSDSQFQSERIQNHSVLNCAMPQFANDGSGTEHVSNKRHTNMR